MKNLIAMAVAFAVMTLGFASAAEEPRALPRWTIGAGWGYTSLGAPAPEGFGTSGGHTAIVSARRVVLGGDWGSIDAALAFRCYGFNQEGPRTVGIEADLGAVVSRRFVSLLSNDLLAWFGASLGGYRAPFQTAIGPYRWIGVRPAVDFGVRLATKDRWTVDVSANLRRYDVLVWSGWSVSANVLGGWSW